MEVHQLRYAVAVADERTFTGAAAALRISQSSVSTQVARLERELGLVLFERTPRRVVPTAAGLAVLDRARTALRAVDAVREAADDALGLVRGAIVVGAPAGLTWSRFFDAVAALHRRHPGLAVTLREGRSADLQAEVAAGRVDVALVAWSRELRDDLGSWTVVDEDVVVVLPPDHALAASDVVRAAELGTSPLVCLQPGSGARDALDGVLREEGLPRSVAWEVGTPGAVADLVTRGVGVGVLSRSSAVGVPGLVARPIGSDAARSRLSCVWRSGAVTTPATRAALGVLHEHLVD